MSTVIISDRLNICHSSIIQAQYIPPTFLECFAVSFTVMVAILFFTFTFLVRVPLIAFALGSGDTFLSM